ncbi:hypothetical protein D6D27_08881 [Aureobasidium pullulans]|nr:hypothetical protein D6D27_08881 [Aureobasidium pullulans]
MPAKFPDMPEIIASADLRKGPVEQDTIGWMNAVQSCLDDYTSWDRYTDGEIFVRIHMDKTSCTLARISLRATDTNKSKGLSKYYSNELEPAICKLVRQEEKRVQEMPESKSDTENEDDSEQEANKEVGGAKRKREDQEDCPESAKKIKQEADQKCEGIIEGLHDLRDRVAQTGSNSIVIRRAFLKLEGDILELMAAED